MKEEICPILKCDGRRKRKEEILTRRMLGHNHRRQHNIAK
jgi:hypothetical protein